MPRNYPGYKKKIVTTQISNHGPNGSSYGYSIPSQAPYAPAYGTQPSSASSPPNNSFINNIDINNPLSLSNLDAWFNHFDRDQSGHLDKEETVSAVAQTYGAHGKLLDISSLRQSVYSTWAVFDTDNSGSINRREFMSSGGLGESLQAMMGVHSAPPHSQFADMSLANHNQHAQNHIKQSFPQNPEPKYQVMKVTIPEGMGPGQLIKIPLPSGDMATITIPDYSIWDNKSSGEPTFDCRIPITPTGMYKSQQEQHSVISHLPSFESWNNFRGVKSPDVGLRSIPVNPSHHQFIPPSGRRKALIIGINYFGTQASLQGCINDAKNMQILLEGQGYPNDSEHLLLLTDDPNSSHNHKPTGANIIKAMQWLLKGVSKGDMLFFHFSGHGSQVIDETGFEKDGLNETIVPVDYQKGQLKDDQLWDQMIYPLPAGANLTAVMDCCHSGTGLDLAYEYQLPKKNLFKAFDPNANIFIKGRWIDDINSAHSQGDVVLFSGCEDDQTSADTDSNILGKYQAGGAMTQSFIQAFKAHPKATYPQFMESIHQSLKQRGFTQHPQLTSSQKFDVNARIFSLVEGIEPNENPKIGRIQNYTYKSKKKHGGSGVDKLLGINPKTAVGVFLGAMALDAIF